MACYPDSIKITIPGLSPSRNETDKWTAKRQFWRKKKLKQLYWWQIFANLRLNGIDLENIQVTAPVKRKVIFTSFRSRRLDEANLSGGLKHLCDVLTEMRLIHNDGPKWLEDYYKQEIDSKDHRVEVEIFGEFEANVLKSSRRMI